MKRRLAPYRPFRTPAPEAVKASGPGKTLKIRRISRSPVQILADEWSKAISRTDAHAQGCQGCNHQRNTRRFQIAAGAVFNPDLEPYRLCRIAKKFELEERAAREAYRAAGGRLPVVRSALGGV